MMMMIYNQLLNKHTYYLYQYNYKYNIVIYILSINNCIKNYNN